MTEPAVRIISESMALTSPVSVPPIEALMRLRSVALRFPTRESERVAVSVLSGPSALRSPLAEAAVSERVPALSVPLGRRVSRIDI